MPIRHRKNTNLIIESVLRRLLKEDGAPTTTEGLAAYVVINSSINIVVYKYAALNLCLKKNYFNAKAIEESIVAFISLESARSLGVGPSRDGWVVKSSVGPGYGQLIYGLAYAASPSGIIVPDRDYVSDSAFSSWTKAFAKGRHEPLDDIDNPQTPDPNDDSKFHTKTDIDCKKGRDPKVLNYAYHGEGWEKEMLRSLSSKHDSMIKSIDSLYITKAEIERVLLSGGNSYFLDTIYKL